MHRMMHLTERQKEVMITW